MKTRSNKLYLPIFFQGKVEGVYPLTGESYTKGGSEFGEAVINVFIPDDTSMIDQVYIPLHQRIERVSGLDGHWFCIVVNIQEKRVYYLDSIAAIQKRYDIVKKVLYGASMAYGNDRRLGYFFNDVSSHDNRVVNTKKQTNGHDCGMFVLKYIEANNNYEWSQISFTTDEMHVERMNSLVKLVNNEFNTETRFKTKKRS